MVEIIRMRGGKKLFGSVTVGGMKNAALPILFASILTNSICVLDDIPPVDDVLVTLEILSQMGAKIRYLGHTTVEIDPSGVCLSLVPIELTRKLRGSSYLLGAGLGREGNSNIGIPGGCDFGARPLDIHYNGLRALGAEIREEGNQIFASAGQGLVGTPVRLNYASVGATANLLLASVTASGKTLIENAAEEPHIVDLANFLNLCGANITGAGSTSITVQGVERLHGCRYRILPDMIEAGTYMTMACGCGGEVELRNVVPEHLRSVTERIREMGGFVKEGEDCITVLSSGHLTPARIITEPYPGFPTDMHPQMAVLCTLANGVSSLRETVWKNRFQYVGELKKMGAEIITGGRTALIFGGNRLHGADVTATDLRAGAALVFAGLCAEGQTVVCGANCIRRGYANLVQNLAALGAEIEESERP